jgi:Uma2 family endonuclease
MAAPKPRRATYQDLVAAPEHKVAEIIDGELFLSPRPAPRHALAAAALGEELGPPFKRGRGGPGGWMILDEPELHLGEDVLVPDLAGWRTERLPAIPSEPYFTLEPDWICEVLSPSTERLDRTRKLALHARAGVRHAWLIHPVHRSLEVLRLHEGSWLLVAVHRDDQRVRAEPFDAIELDLAILWAGAPPVDEGPWRASEKVALYEPEAAP